MESEDEFALGGNRSPDPDAFGILFYFGYQFIQLQMADGQSAVEQSLMESFAVVATAFNPAGDGGVVMVEDASGGGNVNPFRHGCHDRWCRSLSADRGDSSVQARAAHPIWGDGGEGRYLDCIGGTQQET